ncbi:MAG: VWA domain-containing protein [Pyrinomonadaceae bacterium]|nr:VWA domain-containing protein [Pyrinomonadaceae bacterium]
MTDQPQNDRPNRSFGRSGKNYGPLPHIRILAAVLIAALLSAAVWAQEDDRVVKVETELASFEVTALDTSGRPVAGLTDRDFRIFENGKERQIDFFQPITDGGQKRPLLVVFALDVSGSMTEPELDRLRSAMNEFVKRLAGPDTYFAVMTFAMEVKTLQGFTNRVERVERSLYRIARDQDGLSTHAYDAVDDAVRLINNKAPKTIRGKAPKKAVVAITDGFPVGDVVSPETVTERANETGVSVFSVILPSFSKLSGSKRPLLTPFESSDLVSRTGGLSLYANEKDLDPLFASLAERIATSYAIAFYPTEERSNPGEFRSVRIESKKGFRVTQNRPGYQVSNP